MPSESGIHARRALRYEWAIAACAILIDAVTTFMPRADKAGALRGELRNVHVVLGLALLALCIGRLLQWQRGISFRGNAILPPLISGWISALCVGLLLLLALNPLFGVVSAWSMAMLPGQGGGEHVVLDRAVWLFSGYFHSALGFGVLLLKVAMVLTGGYAVLRYRAGMLAAFPAPLGVLALVGLGISVFALSTFKSYERGPVVVGVFVVLCASIWALSRLRRPRAGGWKSPPRRWPAVVVALLIALGLYGPHAMFRVSPIETAANAGPAGVMWHEQPGRVEAVPPETSFEREVRAETFKWCTFCHAMKKGAQHMAGPNLYGVFGQRMAAAPNFAYGAALKARGERGEVWDDDALDALLADPDQFAPGTTMVISSGNVTDPARRKAIINILKRETGAALPAADGL